MGVISMLCNPLSQQNSFSTLVFPISINTMKKLLILVFLYSSIIAFGQPAVSDFKQVFRLEITETSKAIDIDGQLTEEVWQSANVGSDFWLKVPYFAEGADPKTEVMLTYDKDHLYVAAKCYQKEDILVQSLKRDEYWDNDGIAIMLDPLNTRTNGYLFGLTAVGAQWDALRSIDDINSDWSNKWYSATYDGDGYWSMEMAIPLRILRYSADGTEWGMNFVRNHMNENEYHNWTAVPESFWPPDPAFAGALVFDKAPDLQKGNYNLIPYVTSSINDVRGEKTKIGVDLGLDARLSVTPTLNLDLTFNPDFSQIEADQLVTNLTRFNIFLPERRTFFLENNDLFSDYGYPGVRPFFSRRIGLDSERQAVPIVYGARLTGNITKSTRVGLMNIHSASSDNTNAQNQTAISVQKQMGLSYFKGYVLNRQGFDGVNSISSDYGRNVGLEAAYNSDNGQLALWISGHQSFKKDITSKTGFYTGGMAFTNPNWEILVANGYTQENYFADMGFVQRIENYDAARDTVIRVGFNENVANFTYRLRPKSGFVTRHNFSTFNKYFLNIDWSLNESINELDYSVAFRNTAEFGLNYTFNEVNLLYPFGFVSSDNPLPAGNYKFSFLSGRYSSDERKAISYSINGRTGGFYSGNLNRAEANVNFRVQPWANLSFGYQWNDLDLGTEYGDDTITALLSKLEIGFNKNLFWTTLFQYLDQSEFLGINSRLQWRFAPMSDLYIVFVDNYDVMNGLNTSRSFVSDNRALILKFNYWY